MLKMCYDYTILVKNYRNLNLKKKTIKNDKMTKNFVINTLCETTAKKTKQQIV